MSSLPCPHPLPLEQLVDYLSGDLDPATESRFEDHVFDCGFCAQRFQVIHDLGAAVADAFRHAMIGVNVNGALVERTQREGLTVREYRIAPDETVPCSASPEDLVAVRLSGDFASIGGLSVETEFLDIESGERAPTVSRSVEADRERNEIILLFPGELVRSFPRSQWTLTVYGEVEKRRRALGTFVMDHTP